MKITWLLCATIVSGLALAGPVYAAETATGTFDVKLNPAPESGGMGAFPGRMIIDKQFHGDLEGSAAGQMLMAMTEVEGSAGYVAIERVTGALKGKKGTFVLQHNGTMGGGKSELNIVVVPDSGTGELKGLTGRMTVIIEKDGTHRYEFAYEFSGAVAPR